MAAALNPNRLKQALWQTPALLFLAGLMALGVNHWRSDGIPLVGNWSAEARFADAAGDSPIVSIEEAGRLFEKNEALFVDARPRSQFEQGHIRGALSLPWEEVDRWFAETAGRLEGASLVIAYCDGESCELSHELALFLKEMGLDSVAVLVNGWTVWQAAGLPTEAKTD